MFSLSRRQWQVAELLVAQCTDREIAEQLLITPKTAGHHVSAILAKLDVPTRVAARQRLLEARGQFVRDGDLAVQSGAHDVRCNHQLRSTRDSPFGLTSRERQIADLLVDRLTDRQIADVLVISRKTVSHHVASVLAKLGVTNRGAVRGILRPHQGTGAATQR
ncbi:hypothetical protein A5630_24780 [Mycolicibacterium mucogenicum]|uniref:HTH luxR-type domain-containing protein n=1 Tax=Mycolicibacterium mucogenicum TaxID=56689 RepID=A0A1A3GX27_MYCMU|nr:helix-turn-helix transcriptional regulator [Mycolicibacterium mucogenicum]OBJ40597.1 hypothetical protein A5630_24780 [Mycolicibacterium mucogenicum]